MKSSTIKTILVSAAMMLFVLVSVSVAIHIDKPHVDVPKPDIDIPKPDIDIDIPKPSLPHIPSPGDMMDRMESAEREARYEEGEDENESPYEEKDEYEDEDEDDDDDEDDEPEEEDLSEDERINHNQLHHHQHHHHHHIAQQENGNQSSCNDMLQAQTQHDQILHAHHYHGHNNQLDGDRIANVAPTGTPTTTIPHHQIPRENSKLDRIQIQNNNQHHETSDAQTTQLADPSDRIHNIHSTNEDELIDGERMLEVTRKLVRNTERDPDRDLRKQVLLKTAIKKLPNFVGYNRYSETLDRSFHSNLSTQTYYEHHDAQHNFYHSVQPNAIQMSTTSLRMLDLNDDRDPELVATETDYPDPNLGYTNDHHTSLDQNDFVGSRAYDRVYERYHPRGHELNQYETSSPMISCHNTLDNLYQPINGSDIPEDIKDERIPIAFQISCEIYDFTCAPDDKDRKLLDNITSDFYTSDVEKETINDAVVDGDSGCSDTRDQDGSDSNSSSHSSSSESESANSSMSQSTEADNIHSTSLVEASLNSSSDFYHSSHDSGVALFSTKSNKRSSSSIGLDDEMEIDHSTELLTRSPSIISNNQCKKLRKREIIE